VEAEDAYHAVQEEYEKAEEEFEKFRIVYEQVNNPLTYSEIIRDQLQETRLNRDHVRQEVQNWSIISRASTAFGFVLILVAVILLFTSVGQIAIAALPGIVGAITIGASRLAFTQYNDSKKRFDAFSLRAENLQRELMGLSHRSIDSGAASQQSIDTNTKEPNANEPKDDSSPK
jgi:hypothetical protein